MESLVAVLFGIVIAILSFAVVFNLATGQFKPKSNLGFLLTILIVVVITMLVFPNEPLERNLPLMWWIVVPGSIYIIQFMWYMGPLEPIRRRRNARLRDKWQVELKMWQNWVEALEFLDTCDHKSDKTNLHLSVARKEVSRFQKKLALLS